MTNEERYVEVLATMLNDLSLAEVEYLKPTSPVTPLCRPKKYWIVYPDISWPCLHNGKVVTSFSIQVKNDGISYGSAYGNYGRKALAVTLVQLCKGQPRKIVRAIYSLSACIKWCQKRAAGRQRAAAEILRQQAEPVKTLEEIIALNVLGRLGNR